MTWATSLHNTFEFRFKSANFNGFSSIDRLLFLKIDVDKLNWMAKLLSIKNAFNLKKFQVINFIIVKTNCRKENSQVQQMAFCLKWKNLMKILKYLSYQIDSNVCTAVQTCELCLNFKACKLCYTSVCLKNILPTEFLPRIFDYIMCVWFSNLSRCQQLVKNNNIVYL